MDKSLKSEIKTIKEILELQTQYSVPNFQRRYTWKDKNIKSFFEDLNSYSENNKDFFLGTILLKNSKKTKEIVDGQQRITTILLFFKAIENFLNKEKNLKFKENKENIEILITSFKKYFFIVEENELKLKLHDLENIYLFEYIILNGHEEIEYYFDTKKEINFYKNYLNLYNKIKKIKNFNIIKKRVAKIILKKHSTGLITLEILCY